MKPKFFTQGDIDGFIALFLDNLVVAILMAKLCLGFPLNLDPDFFYSRVLPASAIGLIIGNVFYAWQARRLAAREGRDDVCALPFGLSIVFLITFVFLIMYPAKLAAERAGLSAHDASLAAVRAGVGAAFLMGACEALGSFVAEKIRRVTPRPALLSALAGIGLGFLALDLLFRSYAFPIVGLVTFGLAMIFYFGRLQLRARLPRGLVIVAAGIALAWLQYAVTGQSVVPVGELDFSSVGLHLPQPDPSLLLTWWGSMAASLPVVLPLALLNTVATVQVLDSAEVAGDRFEPKSSLFFNGFASMGSALFGSPFMTTVYLGHPGWKAVGARTGYSLLNAGVMTVLCCTGSIGVIVYFIPVEAGIALIIWIGLAMAAQSFEASPAKYFPAVLIGLIPAFAAHTSLVVQRTLTVAGLGTADRPIPLDLMERFAREVDFFAGGAFGLGEGYIYTSMVLSAVTVHIIDRRFRAAAVWFALGGVLALVGLTHSFEVTANGILSSLRWGHFHLATAYFMLAAACLVVPRITVPDDKANSH
jgi:adenine/guanine/hypoxanthine permease